MVSLILISVLGVAEGRQVINDPAHDFLFELPSEFQPKPDTKVIGPNETKGMLGVWMVAPSEEKIIVVSLDAMGGVIGRDTEDQMKRLGETFPVTWKTFELTGVRMTRNHGDSDMVIFGVQIPSKPSAIQLLVAGPVSNEAAIRAEFDDALAHFDAPSNWLSGDERIARGIEGLMRLGMTFVVLVLIIGGIGSAIRKRRAQK